MRRNNYKMFAVRTIKSHILCPLTNTCKTYRKFLIHQPLQPSGWQTGPPCKSCPNTCSEPVDNSRPDRNFWRTHYILSSRIYSPWRTLAVSLRQSSEQLVILIGRGVSLLQGLCLNRTKEHKDKDNHACLEQNSNSQPVIHARVINRVVIQKNS